MNHVQVREFRLETRVLEIRLVALMNARKKQEIAQNVQEEQDREEEAEHQEDQRIEVTFVEKGMELAEEHVLVDRAHLLRVQGISEPRDIAYMHGKIKLTIDKTFNTLI